MRIPSPLVRLKAVFSLRLILAVMLIIASVFTVTYVSKYLDARKEAKAKEVAVKARQKQLDLASKSKTWNEIDVPHIKVKKARLRTKYADGQIHYKLSIDIGEGFNYYAFNQSQYPFMIAFAGDDEFEVMQIQLSQMTKTSLVNDNGSRVGIDFSGSFTTTLDYYLAAKTWSLVWQF
ncbi:hypothetical protein [Phnomibacter sp. MR]|uniref:hypothetical protein n=1 Tax=Phnomibacter sp. MR TaxID=3042318 RepID=UPI003A7FEE2A